MLTTARRRTQRGVSKRTIESRFIQEMSGVIVKQKMDTEPWDISDSVPTDAVEITVGSVVRHKRFGVGKVQRVIRRPRGSTVTIQFRSGVKHLVLEYANLELVRNSDNSGCRSQPEF